MSRVGRQRRATTTRSPAPLAPRAAPSGEPRVVAARARGSPHFDFVSNHSEPTVSVQTSPRLRTSDLVVTMLPLVKRIAVSFSSRLPPAVSVDDLVSAGLLALVELERRSGTLPPEDLERLAVARLRGAMLDEMRQADPLSRRIRRRAKQVGDLSRQFEARHGRPPTDDELGASLGLSPRVAVMASALARSISSSHSDSERLAELPDMRRMDPERVAQRGERFARVRTAVEKLPSRQREIVELYFGADLTLRQIGVRFGVTEARISQLLSAAVKELRTNCASMPPPAA